MMFSYLVVCLTTVAIFAQHSNNIDFKSFPCEPGYKTNKDCFKIYPNIICTACSEWEYQNYCFNHFTNATCMTCTECDVLASACAISQSSFCKLSNDTQQNDTPRNSTHVNNIQKDMLYGVIIIVLCVPAALLTCIFLILRKRMKKRRLENQSCQIVHDENILIERPESKIELLEKKIELPTRIRKKKDDKVPMLTKYDKSRRCVNEYTPLDVELGQDGGTGLSSIMEEHDDSSRCEIENTPLLDVRCEIKNTTPLDVELNKDERIGVSSLAEPDQTTGYINICSKPREVNMQDSSKFSDESTDKNINYESDDDNETTPLNPKETERQIAVVYPYDEAKSIGRKEVGHIDDRLQQITKESLQVTGDYENTEARGSEIKIKENQLCHRSGDQSLSSMDLDKGTSELQINWIKVFVQLSTSFPASKWKLFAIDLLSNCQQMAKSVHDAVDEIELEAKNQHTENCFIHAYLKVFNKWLDNLGRTNATFEHIKDAVSATIEAKEALELVLSIERKPPLKVTTPMPLVPYNLNQTFGNNSTHSQQYMALHDDEVPGNSNYARDVYVRSRQQTHRVQVAHCSYCSRYTTNEVSNLQETSVQLNKTSVETNCNNNDKNTVKRERNKKRKKDQSKSKPQQHKRSTTEQYMIDNAKENLLLDSIPIRQNDYKMFMNFVLDLVSNECNVGKETVLSITHEEFCEAQEINTKENDTFFLVKTGKTNLFIGKEVYEDLAVYGNIARPKLLTYLKAKNIDYDSTASERFLFITFNGKPLMENKDDKNVSNIAAKEKATEQNIQVNRKNDPFVRVCPDMKESEEHVNITTTLKQNPSDHLCDSEQSINGIGKNNTSIEDEFYPGAAITEHDKKELDNKAGCGQDTIRIKEKENKKEETNYFDLDIEKELEKIKESFFPTGDESYALPDADNVAEVLSKFVDKDLYNSP